VRVEERRLAKAPRRRQSDSAAVRRRALQLIQLGATIDQPCRRDRIR